VTDASGAFAALHRHERPFLLPNAWDFASAAALTRVGFRAIGTTSLGVAASAGKPDAAAAIRAENLRLAESLSRLPVMVSVDIEAGYSDDPDEVASYAREIARTGAVGVNIEDGEPNGLLGEPALLREKLRAVKAAAPRLFLNARTDTFWLGSAGGADRLQETIARTSSYVAAGADGIFVPGLSYHEDVLALSGAVAAPLNVLFAPGKASLEQLGAAGARRVSTGSLLFRMSLGAAAGAAERIRSGDLLEPNACPTYGEVQAMVLTTGDR
jgi:2-methylisocitrate lyase-like PEP mutase family enzyme